nr:hypothetical protein RSP673_07655 [Ralstonia solanacearum P673]
MAGKIKAVTEYVRWEFMEGIDPDTGEFIRGLGGDVIPAATTQMPTLDLRDKPAKKDAILAGLRLEVREFARFVLGYANKRRGITPGINTLCHWYADLTGKRADNIRRHIPKLEAAGILANENLLGPLFQRTGCNARVHLGEEAAANTRYTLQKVALSFRIEGKVRPAWLEDAEPTGNLTTHEIYSDLMYRVGLPIAHTAHEVACVHA